MSDENDISIFPIAGWEIGTLNKKGTVFFQPRYLATPFDDPESAHIGMPFALTPSQAKELSEKLLKAARIAETSDAEVAPSQKH